MNTVAQYLKTTAAARALGVPYHALYALLRDNKLPPPARDSSGDFCWTPENLELARQVLRTRRGRRAGPA
jgi:hypothetical protein